MSEDLMTPEERELAHAASAEPAEAAEPGAEADAEPAAAAPAPPSGRNFARSTAGVFATRMGIFGLAFISAFLVARLLVTPANTGAYGTAMLYATMAYTLSQLGLPAAVIFFTGRGRAVADVRRVTLGLFVGISILAVVVALAIVPLVHATFLANVPDQVILAAIASVPFQFGTALLGSILYGRHRFREYNLIQLGQYASQIALIVVLIAALGLGVTGGVLAYTLSQALGVIVIVAILFTLHDDAPAPRLSARELLRYSLKIYPATVPSFFSYRADVFLLNGFNVGLGPVGLYAIAVRIAEALFYVPDAIATVFYPTVASATREEANRRVVAVTKFTLLATGLGAIAIIPTAYVFLRLFLPKFMDSMPALVVILPGIVSLSLSKVLASYVQGVGRPYPVSAAAIIALVINLVANIILIPRIGIVGASASSLISYSCHAAMMLTISSRISGRPIRAFITPGRTEIAMLVEAARVGVRKGRARLRRTPSQA